MDRHYTTIALADPPDKSHTRDGITQRILAAKGGDLDAYEALFAATIDRLQLFLRVRLGAQIRKAEESLDLVQETYLAAHRAFDEFEVPTTGDPERALFGWLCTIAENCIRARADHHGAKKRSPTGQLERVSRILEGVAAGTIGPATRAERSDERSRVATAMLALPDTQRELLMARHFEGLSFAAIADRRDSSETSVRRDVANAVEQLGKKLAEVQS